MVTRQLQVEHKTGESLPAKRPTAVPCNRPVIARLNAVSEIQGLTPIINNSVILPLACLRSLTAVPRSTQPFTLHGMIK